MRVFIDASAFFALYYTSDPHHQDAQAMSEELAAADAELLTSNYVVAEALTILSQRAGKAVALSFGKWIREGEMTIVRVSEELEDAAFERFRTAQKDVSYADCTSFAVCDDLGITDVFGFDSDFERYGFVLLESRT